MTDPPVPAARSSGLDPRTKIFLVVLVSTAVLSPQGDQFLLPGLVLAVALAIFEHAWRRAWMLPVFVAVMWLLGQLVAQAWPSPATALVLLTCTYFMRFAVAVGVGAHLFATTSPASLNAAVRALRAPRVVAVMVVVMIRFFPVVWAEAAAVFDAMRLRGLTTPARVLRHPVRSIERFTVPMIASSLRASEDLSAAAILRGLGSYHRPTALHPPRLSRTDAAWLLLVILLSGAAILLPTGRS